MEAEENLVLIEFLNPTSRSTFAPLRLRASRWGFGQAQRRQDAKAGAKEAEKASF
jgi:hypothetical protein